MLPSHVGSALGERHGGATYFMFEVHYENPGQETCELFVIQFSVYFYLLLQNSFISLLLVVDSSGVKIFYTD